MATTNKTVSVLPTRVLRESGQQTRDELVDAAIKPFSTHGFDGVSVAEVARLAGAFPNQVTYYFGGKEGLFVAAASKAVLRAAKQAERNAKSSASIEDHARGLIAYLLGPGAMAVMLFAEAMLIARRKPALSEEIRKTLQMLHEAGEAAMVATLMRTGWEARTTPEVITRAFWASIFGLALEKAATGKDFEFSSAEAVALLMMNLNQHFSPPA